MKLQEVNIADKCELPHTYPYLRSHCWRTNMSFINNCCGNLERVLVTLKVISKAADNAVGL